MRTWRDYPELSDKERFAAELSAAGSFAELAKRLSCSRICVRRAAEAHGVRSPYYVVPKYLRR